MDAIGDDRLLLQARGLQRQGHRTEAIETLREWLKANPDNGEVWYELGYLLKHEGLYEEALEAFGQALMHGAARPEEVHLNRGVLYADHFRRDALAERELHAALAIAPDYVPALLNLGNLHEERGERDQALSCYERVLGGSQAADPEHNQLRFEGLARSAQLRPATSLDDPLLERLRQAAEAQPNKVVRADLLFALGQSYDRLGSYDLAFESFAKANRWLLRYAGRRYDHDASSRLTDALISAFPSGTPDDLEKEAAESTPEPLFICGMFRSGSTLIEQVLASHPQITAGGELNYLRRLASVQLAPFPQSMAVPDPERDASLAAGYRTHLTKLFPEGILGAYITDKRPDNFLLIGLIKRLFPRARIIHTQRHPLDVGLSVFSHHLQPQVAAYSCDLADIGHYYGQYQRLMAHWKDLHGDSIIDFDYDTFVRDPEPAVRRLLDFLGLPWHQGCLDFHRRRSTVKTASYWQIRQPLHTAASGRWRHYSRHLAPMLQELVKAGISPADA